MYTPKGEINDALMKLMENPEFLEELEKAEDAEAAYEAAKESISDITIEEFQQSMKIMHDYLEENEDGELSEDELDAVAGGKGGAKPGIGIGEPIVDVPSLPAIDWSKFFS